MEDALLYDRLQFAFTITFHYLFPQLTMGLSILLVVYKGLYLKTGFEKYNKAALFWAKVFALNFVMGVVTGIPMEFQFGTNWSQFSALTGNVIGQPLAMEGMFSFFLESSFLGLFLFGEKLLGQKLHFLSALLVCIGTQASGFLIIATNAWMQHPVGYEILENGEFVLNNFGALFTNPWLWPSFLHNQVASVVTAAFFMAGIGAYYQLRNMHLEQAALYLKTGVIAGLISSVLLAFPLGDILAKKVAEDQPVTFAAMEGLFETTEGAPLALIGQPNMKEQTLDNKIEAPNILSFLTHKNWNAKIKGLNEYPREEWPSNVPALYYSYHIMVGLGTMFIGLMSLAAFLLWRKKLGKTPAILWLLMLAIPFPYIANTAGWYTSELGRQPWLVYNLLKTADGISPVVSAGNSLFTFIGFIGLYILLGLLALLLFGKIVYNGPETKH
jgi:cytochrome d ubiquinol oxidase subunit I